jgi:hypothetical protein
MFFSLTSEKIGESGVANVPYQVFDTYGNVMYSVHNKNLLYGYSSLDKALMVDSESLDLYYLQYRTPQSFSHILFVINKIRLVDRDFASFDNDLGEKIVASNIELNNQIVFTARRDDVHINLNDPFLNPYPIKIGFLADISSSIPSRENIASSNRTRTEVYDLALFNSYIFTPERSGWMIFYQDTETGREYLETVITLGEGVDRFISVSPGIYYVALSHEVFPHEVREFLSIEDREPGTISNVIDIRVELSI